MIINDTLINADCETIVSELQRQLSVNKISYLQKSTNTASDIMVQCPFHGNGQERRPSAGIRKSDGTLHCFACGEVHTLPEVISYCFGYTNDILGKEGFKWIVKNFLSVRKEERKQIEINIKRNITTNKATVLDNSIHSKSNTFVTEEELDSYRYYHEYWTKRGITDDNIIELFDLGYDQKTNEIIMPNYDRYGHCVFVARRSVKGKRFSYPKDTEKIVYGIYQLYQLDKFPLEVYITESMIDCILLWQAGKYAVALNGTGSAEQIETLKKLPVRHYILATDNDKAGQRARSKLRNALSNKLITEVILPDGRKDIGECTDEEIQNLEEVF